MHSPLHGPKMPREVRCGRLSRRVPPRSMSLQPGIQPLPSAGGPVSDASPEFGYSKIRAYLSNRTTFSPDIFTQKMSILLNQDSAKLSVSESSDASHSKESLKQQLETTLMGLLGNGYSSKWFHSDSNVFLDKILKADPATKLNRDGSIDYASANLSRSLTVFFDGLEAKLTDMGDQKFQQLLNKPSTGIAEIKAEFKGLFEGPVFSTTLVHSLQIDSRLQRFQSVPVTQGIFSSDIQHESQPIRGDGNCFPRSIALFLLELSLETASPVSIQTFADQELQALFTGYQASGTSKKQIIEDTMRYLKRKASENFDCNNILFLHQAIAGFNQSSKGKAEEATLLDSLKALVPSKTADLIYQDVIAHQLNLAAWTAAGKQELAEDGTWLSHQDLKPVLSGLGVGIAIYSRPYRSEAHWQRHYDLTQHPFVVGLEYINHAHYNLLAVQPSSGAKTYNLNPYLRR